MTIIVRPPHPQDVNRLAAVNVAAWRSAYAGIVPPAYLDAMQPSTYRERWVKNVSDRHPDRAIFVAEIDGIVAGYCSGGPYRPQQDASSEDVEDLGELYAVYTDPAMQRHGAGSAMHAELLRWLHAHGYREAALWVLRDNRDAMGWYGAHGWRPDGATSTWLRAGTPLVEMRLRRAVPGIARPQAADGSTLD